MYIVLGMLGITVQEYALFFKGEGSVVWLNVNRASELDIG